jgi:uncharacterized membrane protein
MTLQPAGISNIVPGAPKRVAEFFAPATSFLTILVMWMNHHNMFNYVKRLNRRFMILNGLLLMFVTLTPFTTLLVSEHLLDSNATVSAATYAGIFFLLSLVWNVFWHLASDNFRLLSKGVSANQIAKVKRQYYVGPMLYAVAFFASFLSGLVSVVLINSNSCFLRHNSNDW